MPQIEAAQDVSFERYGAVILPDLQPLGDSVASKLDTYVAGGGTLIAAGRTGLRDEQYEPRRRPVLECLGIERLRFLQDQTRSTYLKLDSKEGFPGFSDTDLIYVDGPYLFCDYLPETEKRFKMVPPHRFGPPERCYYEQVIDQPGFTIHSFGKGKAIHLPWLPGELFYRQGHTNTIDFAADLIEQVAGVSPAGGNLSPMVEVTLLETEDGISKLLHLVNGSGHFGTTFYEPVPMYDLNVVLPWESKPGKAISLVSGDSVSLSYASNTLTVSVARLELMEAVLIT
jgi:hypothetical protein